MGDRVAVLRDGKLQQIAKPRELYDHPVNTFVAGFIGAPGMNLLEAPVRDGTALLGGLRLPLPRTADFGPRVVVGVRPESWEVVSPADGDALRVDTELLEELGAESFVYADIVDGDDGSRSGKVVARVDRKFTLEPGARLQLRPRPDEVYFFDARTEQRIA